MIKVLLADDHQIVLDGLRLLLNEEDNIQVSGEANNGREVLSILSKEKVDIAVLDLEMPVMGGIDTAIKIKNEYPDIRILILTMYNNHVFIHKLIELGVSGYILKNRGKEELVEAINDIYSGKKYFGRSVTNTLINNIQETAANKPQKKVLISKREEEVLRHIADGLSTPQISEKLFIAHSTVETHRRNLIEKTGAENSKSLIKWAFQNEYFPES